jgi:NADH-quinone oxidoreductase subunit L
MASSSALKTVAWVGVATAVFAALIAVAQRDIKRILAYSTVSQLGYMFLGLGVGGVPVAMFHLITHAFFKALLFLGAGSVIHGCHEEQDIGRMGGLRKYMPLTFATYAIGMMALSGVPLLFSGFWSKDEILHSAFLWQPSRWPFYLGVFGAFLTAFYMTRQMYYVFFGSCRLHLGRTTASEQVTVEHGGTNAGDHAASEIVNSPHESPPVMVVPLIVLAAGTVLLSIFGTPLWPAFEAYMAGHIAHLEVSQTIRTDTILVMIISTAVVATGIWIGWWLYAKYSQPCAEESPDALEKLEPDLFTVLRNKFYVDELYDYTIVRFHRFSAQIARWLDTTVWEGLVILVSYVVLGVSWLSRLIDEFLVNAGFDEGCRAVRRGGGLFSQFENGQVQRYLKVLGLALVVFGLIFVWGCRG